MKLFVLIINKYIGISTGDGVTQQLILAKLKIEIGGQFGYNWYWSHSIRVQSPQEEMIKALHKLIVLKFAMYRSLVIIKPLWSLKDSSVFCTSKN